jgi:hypothetical protein
MNYPSPLFTYKPREEILEEEVPSERENEKRLDPKLPIK